MELCTLFVYKFVLVFLFCVFSYCYFLLWVKLNLAIFKAHIAARIEAESGFLQMTNI